MHHLSLSGSTLKLQNNAGRPRPPVEHRDRHEEVPSCITDQPFDFALVVAFARSTGPRAWGM